MHICESSVFFYAPPVAATAFCSKQSSNVSGAVPSAVFFMRVLG